MKISKIKVLSGVLAGIMALSMGVISYAANTRGNENSGNTNRQQMMQKNNNQKPDMSVAFAQAVANGTITQAKSDELVAYLAKKDTERQTQMADRKAGNVKPSTDVAKKDGKMQGPLSCAVTDGIITAEQAQAIGDIIRASQENAKSEAMKTQLAKLVTAGTITQEQSDKVIAAMEAEKASRIAEKDKISAMTDEERQTYFQNNKPERNMCLANLVTDGTLTQQQADTIAKSVMRGNMGGHGGKQGMKPNGGCNGNRGQKASQTPVE